MRLKFIGIPLFLMMLASCTPLKQPSMHHYQLQAYDKTTYKESMYSSETLLISQTDAMPSYQTQHMLYMKTPFELSEYRENSWASSPSTLFYPLLIQSFQNSKLFKAIASSPFADKVDYRLDTQILNMEQRFLTHPSTFYFTVKATLTRVSKNEVIRSKIIAVVVPCPTDTPYGGVLAANQATQRMTQKIKAFVAQS